ncbi:MAG TPA: hypothetical protein VGO18_16075, partial [Steroidobacteraceae bacterium]|nr:hypothetical protein [Steroidobacteraceae bacterium]
EAIRADYSARVQARLDRTAEQTGSTTAEQTSASRAARPQPPAAEQTNAPVPARPGPVLAESAPNPTRPATRSLEDIRREARENWLKMRAEQSGKVPGIPKTDIPKDAQMQANTPAPDDDYQP